MSDKKNTPRPTIVPSVNGPYLYITDFTPVQFQGLSNSKGEKPANVTYTALCRCGQSENKPFCDGTHGKIHFNDRKETDGHLDKRHHQGQHHRQMSQFRTHLGSTFCCM